MRKKGLPAGKDFEPGESESARSLRIVFNDRIIKKPILKLVNEWERVPECGYCSREEMVWANRVRCNY